MNVTILTYKFIAWQWWYFCVVVSSMQAVIPIPFSKYRIGDNFFFFNWQLNVYPSDSIANHLTIFGYIEPLIVLGCEVMSVRDF